MTAPAPQSPSDASGGPGAPGPQDAAALLDAPGPPGDPGPAGAVRAGAGPIAPAADRVRISGAVWGALAIVYVLWGSTYLAIRITIETMPTFLSAGSRALTAGVLLLALVAWRRGPAAVRVSGRQLGSAALVGVLLLTGGNGLVVLGEHSIPSGLAALLVAIVPLWMVLLPLAFGGARPRPAALGGVLLGLAGLAVLSSPAFGGDIAPAGVIAVVAATLTWAAGSFAARRISMPPDAFAASAYQMIAGGVASLLVALGRGEQHGFDPAQVSGRSWLALAYLVVFGSLVAFTAYAWLLQSAPLTLVATYAYVNPVVAVLLGWLVLSEPLTGPILCGGAIVVAAVCLVVSTERRR